MIPPSTCLIPAAGKGLRARPQTEAVPKGMLRVAGKPILQHTIELVRDQVGITTVILVTGHLGELIRDYFKDGHWLGVEIRYIDNRFLDRGLPWSIYLGNPYIDDYFLVVLGDEYYQDSDHHRIRTLPLSGILAGCGVIKTGDQETIRRNYAVYSSGGRIIRLVEKPKVVNTNLMGTGTFVLSPQIFVLLGRRFAVSDGRLDFIEFLDELREQGYSINAFELQGRYVNINDLAALELANRL